MTVRDEGLAVGAEAERIAIELVRRHRDDVRLAQELAMIVDPRDENGRVLGSEALLRCGFRQDEIDAAFARELARADETHPFLIGVWVPVEKAMEVIVAVTAEEEHAEFRALFEAPLEPRTVRALVISEGDLELRHVSLL